MERRVNHFENINYDILKSDNNDAISFIEKMSQIEDENMNSTQIDSVFCNNSDSELSDLSKLELSIDSLIENIKQEDEEEMLPKSPQSNSIFITEKNEVPINVPFMSELDYLSKNIFNTPELPEIRYSYFKNLDQVEDAAFFTPDVPDTPNLGYSCFEFDWGSMTLDDSINSSKHIENWELFDSSKILTHYKGNLSLEGSDKSFDEINVSGKSLALFDLSSDYYCESITSNFLSSSPVKGKHMTNVESEFDSLNTSNISVKNILNNEDSFMEIRNTSDISEKNILNNEDSFMEIRNVSDISEKNILNIEDSFMEIRNTSDNSEKNILNSEDSFMKIRNITTVESPSTTNDEFCLKNGKCGKSLALFDLPSYSDCELINSNFLSSSPVKGKCMTNVESELDSLNTSDISEKNILNNEDSFRNTSDIPEKNILNNEDSFRNISDIPEKNILNNEDSFRNTSDIPEKNILNNEDSFRNTSDIPEKNILNNEDSFRNTSDIPEKNILNNEDSFMKIRNITTVESPSTTNEEFCLKKSKCENSFQIETRSTRITRSKKSLCKSKELESKGGQQQVSNNLRISGEVSNKKHTRGNCTTVSRGQRNNKISFNFHTNSDKKSNIVRFKGNKTNVSEGIKHCEVRTEDSVISNSHSKDEKSIKIQFSKLCARNKCNTNSNSAYYTRRSERLALAKVIPVRGETFVKKKKQVVKSCNEENKNLYKEKVTGSDINKKNNKENKSLDTSDSSCDSGQKINTKCEANGERIKILKRKLCDGNPAVVDKDTVCSLRVKGDPKLGKSNIKIAKLSITDSSDNTKLVENRKFNITPRVTRARCKLSTENIKASSQTSINLRICVGVSNKKSIRGSHTTVYNKSANNLDKEKLIDRSCSNLNNQVVTKFPTLSPVSTRSITTKSVIKKASHKEEESPKNLRTSSKVPNMSSKLVSKSDLVNRRRGGNVKSRDKNNNNENKISTSNKIKNKTKKNSHFADTSEKQIFVTRKRKNIKKDDKLNSRTQVKPTKHSTRSSKMEKLEIAKRVNSNPCSPDRRPQHYKRNRNDQKQDRAQPVEKRRRTDRYTKVESNPNELALEKNPQYKPSGGRCLRSHVKPKESLSTAKPKY
ncbi:UNVERIFIED_CONTAM: hypothetical protein RMT77_014944 [Armadillidium vulgare]